MSFEKVYFEVFVWYILYKPNETRKVANAENIDRNLHAHFKKFSDLFLRREVQDSFAINVCKQFAIDTFAISTYAPEL